jgi:hypothetical protein
MQISREERTSLQPQTFRRDEIVAGNKFLRMIAAQVKAQRSGKPLAQVVAECWPNDKILDMVVRSASNPAMTSVAGWAAELMQKFVDDSLAALAPMSAGAKTLQAGSVLILTGRGQISAPGFTPAAGNAGFVAEGTPIPVKQLVATPAVLLPYKLAAIAALTQEMIDSSNAERMIGDALVAAAGMALDAVLFDSNPATAARPAGLRNGIAALTPSAQTDFFEAAIEDLATLMNAVAVVGGAGRYLFIAAPGRVIAAQARYATDPSNIVTFLGTPAMGNDLMMVAANGLVSALSPAPDIETSNAAALVMDDTSPGLPGTTGPERSLFQTASVAIKMRWPVSWALRSPSAVAWLTPTWK